MKMIQTPATTISRAGTDRERLKDVSRRVLSGFNSLEPSEEKCPSRDRFQPGAFFRGAAIACAGVGAPAALATGAVRCFSTGHLWAGAGLTLAAGVVGALSLPLSASAAAMATDSRNRSGASGYLAGAALAMAGAGLAIL